jgi:Cu(I)/Ag(I) efflux system protein CusF
MKHTLVLVSALSMTLPALVVAQETRTAEGVGEVKSVDARASKVTLHHGPIAALGWPAMTMTFNADPEVLKAAKPGQKVRFTLRLQDNQVVAIAPQ